jgi:Flp pilus assembly protein TadG
VSRSPRPPCPHPSSRAGPSPGRERGQATVLVAAGLVLAAVVLLAVVAAGSVVVDGARARTAADAAALAGAAEGQDAADALARANGGRLVAYRAEGAGVTVTVALGRARATARAQRDGTWCNTEGSSGGPISYTRPPCPSTPG